MVFSSKLGVLVILRIPANSESELDLNLTASFHSIFISLVQITSIQWCKKKISGVGRVEQRLDPLVNPPPPNIKMLGQKYVMILYLSKLNILTLKTNYEAVRFTTSLSTLNFFPKSGKRSR